MQPHAPAMRAAAPAIGPPPAQAPAVPTPAAAAPRAEQVFDASCNAGGRQAVAMLEGITKLVAKDPAKFGLLEEPDEAEAWESAGGGSFCENAYFPSKLVARWREALSKPYFENAGYDKDELETLKAKITGWVVLLTKAGLEVGGEEELQARLEELIAAAPEAEDSSEEDEGESESEDDG
ncbi:MAG: hypothetical protein J3K34DRAFT_225708 [Monoraphidium minutum]|nr:MAG: hypothetical protein J3K34DRAFT_225708 [Monoraphidium minutum]